MSENKVIIFGATGQVASLAALKANSEGAKVYLASRDTEKPIPTLAGKEDNFERVYADLSKADTVQAAVSKTGAKRAFIYLLMEVQDGMQSIITALKDGGIEHVVMLSSHGVRGDRRKIVPSDPIAFLHARVENHLEDIFTTKGYTAIRPGYFASNALRWKRMIDMGEVRMAYPKAEFDWLSPSDIGAVCGGVLAKPPSSKLDDNAIRLSGPTPLSQEAAFEVVGNVIGKEIKLTEMNDDEAAQFYMKSANFPEARAKLLISALKRRAFDEDDGNKYHSGELHEEAVKNITKYGGKEATKFEDWVKENKQAFLA